MSIDNYAAHLPPHADEVEADSSNIDCSDGENVQEVLEDLCDTFGIGASPGYQFGREGTHSAGTWLIGASTSSNKRGLPFGLNNGGIRKVTVSNENTPSIYTIQVWYHTGNLAGATLVGSVTTTATGSTEDFVVDWSVPQGVQLAVKISATGATKPKQTGVFLVVKGELS